jgi:hypothetical protein
MHETIGGGTHHTSDQNNLVFIHPYITMKKKRTYLPEPKLALRNLMVRSGDKSTYRTHVIMNRRLLQPTPSAIGLA